MLTFTISGYEITAVIGKCSMEKVFGQTAQTEDGSIAITIGEGQKDRALVDTFCHEVVEAICMIYDLDISHQSIQTLGVGLSQCFPTKATAMYLRKALVPQKAKARR